MITLFWKNGNTVTSSVFDAADNLPAGAMWIDIHNPTQDEEKSIEAQLQIEIPTREEVWKNQVLNRFYQENGVAYMTAAIITKVDSPYPQTSAVTFILTQNCLITIRYIAPTSFQNFSQRFLKNPQKFHTSGRILEGLLEEVITRVAYNSEVVVNDLDRLSHDIFGVNAEKGNAKNPSQVMKDVLKRLGGCADLNSKINESLHSINRMLSFFKQVHSPDREVDHSIRTLATDVAALTQQTAFLSDKITFLLDATLGMINVEQNLIIKIFSVAAVFFLPPTLLSSIYGMNFEHMPELQWIFGYPAVIGMMLLCALVPYLYFRKKGWL